MFIRVILWLVGIALATASLSCKSVFQVGHTQAVVQSSAPVTQFRLPQPWQNPLDGTYIQGIEVRKRPNAPEEFLLRALPHGEHMYAHEVDPKLPKTVYGESVFSLDVSGGLRIRTATNEEWESGARIPSKSRLVSAKGQDDSTGEIEYRRKSYAKVGKYWGKGSLSPTGKWLAVFSYNGIKRPPDILFGSEPINGDVFWQIYDTITGKKVFEWALKKVKYPLRYDDPVVWLEERYFLFPDNEEKNTFNVVNLPATTPEVNPITLQLPSRKDAAGKPLPPGDFDEVWIPLVPLTKEQAEKLTARSETEITEVRMSPNELLLAINEETENRRVNRQQKDGPGDYHFRLINTYYYAIALDNLTQARFATKEEFKGARTVSTNRPASSSDPVANTVVSPLPPHRSFSKTGATFGSPQFLLARTWISVFSHDHDQMFIDVYDGQLGHKLMTTTLPFTDSPNELFKRALWIEGGYVLLPLDSSIESFALLQLPDGL